MKKVLLLFCLIGLALAIESDNGFKGIHDVKLRSQLVEKVRRVVETGKDGELSDEDEAVIDDFVDKLFENLRSFIVNNGMNELPLPDTKLSVPGASVDLSKGLLDDISTILRTGDDAIISYSNDGDKRIILTLPFEFEDLKFSYHYHTKVAFISISGDMHGSITKAQFNTQLSFYFKNYTFFLDHLDMDHTGKISVKFTGNSVTDWLADALSTAVTTVLHPFIVGELQKTIRTQLRIVIEQLNENIHEVLDPAVNMV